MLLTPSICATTCCARSFVALESTSPLRVTNPSLAATSIRAPCVLESVANDALIFRISLASLGCAARHIPSTWVQWERTLCANTIGEIPSAAARIEAPSRAACVAPINSYALTSQAAYGNRDPHAKLLTSYTKQLLILPFRRTRSRERLRVFGPATTMKAKWHNKRIQ
jgi:hypothetical protein